TPRGGGGALGGAPPRRTAVFRIAAGRHAAEAQTMLGEGYDGIVCSDRWRAYDYLDPSRRRICWAHLLRDFTAHSEAIGEQQEFGNAGLVIAHDLFDAWQQFQHDAERAALKRGSRRSRPSSAPCSSTPRARAPRPSTTDGSHATCSNAGLPSAPSPTPTKSSRPTTTPNAASAAPSSTASSHSVANPNAAN